MDLNTRMKASRVFKQLSSKCTTESYIGKSLKDNDYVGFNSAGILLIDGSYDLIREDREGVSNLSIPGGKRDGLEEDAYDTALREYNEEKGLYSLSRDDLKEVMWYAPGKYALFIVRMSEEIEDTNHNDIDIHSFSKLLIETYKKLL